MAQRQEPSRQKVSTYVVQDSKNMLELRRLTAQNELVTRGMGGVLPEQSNIERMQRILDIGCGPGGWVIETLKAYPHLSAVGIDISQKMIEYANTCAIQEGVADRVEFHVMDALRPMAFPENAFDLVNLRFASSWARTWEWPHVLTEIRRVTRQGGIIRLTDANVVQSSSPMFGRWLEFVLETLYQAGYFFEQVPDGITSHLADLMHHYAAENVQTRACRIEYQGGTPEAELFREDMTASMKTAYPFFNKWTRLPSDYDALCRQAAEEMQQSEFRATWNLLTVWGTKAL